MSEDGESSHNQFAITHNCQVGPVSQLAVRLLEARVTTVGQPEETQGCTILRTTVPGSRGAQAALPGRLGFWDSIQPTFSGALADGWRACCMQGMLTARLLWRASNNLLTLHPGCCTRPPNGFQSGRGVKWTLRPSLLSSLLAALLKPNATSSKFISSYYFLLSISQSFTCNWHNCSIIFLCMTGAYCINPVISTSFHLSYYTEALFHEILILLLLCFCVRKNEVHQKEQRST